MGCFTTIIDEFGNNMQIHTGWDVCDEYKIGESVNWVIHHNNPGDGTLLDGVYDAWADDDVRRYVIIKDHKVHSVMVYDPDQENSENLVEKYNITSYDKSWWSEDAWQKKELADAERRIIREKEQVEDDEITANMTSNERLAYYMAKPIKRQLNYAGIFRKVLKIIPLEEERQILESIIALGDQRKQKDE